MTFDTECSIPGDHPCLPHHFPGQPVVPGVVLLTEVVRFLGVHRPMSRVTGIPRVKFSAPLLPGTPFTIRLNLNGMGRAVFECSTAEGVLAQGQLELAPREGGS